MQHLSALDALFLQLETPETPMHVGSLILIEKPKGRRGSFYPALRRHIESRMHLAPLFSRKVAQMPLSVANPGWQRVDRVDIDYHIRPVQLAKPGTHRQLEACVAKLHSVLLDRDRPLWEFYVIEGLRSGEVGFYSKIHHAALDGQGGIALAQAMLDVEPTPRTVAPAAARRAALAPSAAKMLGAAFRNTVAQYSRIVRNVPDALRVVGAMGAGAVGAIAAPAGRSALAAVRALLPKGALLGPRTAFNVAVKAPRSFVTLRISLDETKRIARHFGVTLNDVVMAQVSGGLRHYFGKRVPAKSMIGAVPASLRAPGDTSQSNQVTMLLIDLATSVADPVRRLQRIAAASGRAKAVTGGMKNVIPTDLPSLGLPWLMSLLARLYHTPGIANRIPVLANTVVSNVPGPQVPLYLAGGKVMSYYPVSIVVHGLALNVTVQSYNGALDFGLIACRKAVPDLAKFAKGVTRAHEELLAQVEMQEAAA